MNVVEIAVKQPLFLRVGETEYTIEYPLSAVIEAEAKLGRTLKTPGDWFGAQAKDIPVLLRAGLAKNHPEVTEADVQSICDGIGPESTTEFTEALGAVAFPKFLARYKENLERLQANGGSPNVQSVDAL